MQLRHGRGFSLVELAVVLAIVGFLIGGAMMTLSAQVDSRNIEETQRRLEAAREALLAFAIVNRRLPCPAVGAATGDESPAGGLVACTSSFGGFLPARTIGFQPTDTSGYGVDAWGNPIRYAVASTITGCTGGSTLPHFTHQANLKANGVSCRPNNLLVCLSATGTADATPTCGGAANQVTATEVVAFVVFSTGKNGGAGSTYGPDEIENTDGGAPAGATFVSRLPGTADTTGGVYDDQMVLVPVGVLYSKLISAGVLP